MIKIKISKIKNEALKSKTGKNGIFGGNTFGIPEYKYVMTDDVNLFEKDKINILVSEETAEDAARTAEILSRGENRFLNLEGHSGIKRVNIRRIVYFDVLGKDTRVTIGAARERFYISEKLYVLEKELTERNFIRISKSCLVNIAHINLIEPLPDYKLKLMMSNGETLEVNRTYIGKFKERIKLKRR